MTPAAPRHQCHIYQGAPSSYLGEIALTLIEQLKARRRCLYLNSRPMVAGMRWHLASQGVDPQTEMDRGSLILSSDQDHLVDGKFDTDRMIEGLGSAVKQSLADGYVGLRAAGDMTWEFGHELNLDKLLDYERRLEDFMQGNPAISGVCLYHRDTLPAHAVETALITHPALYISATLSQLNACFAKPLVRKAAYG